jgi:hypothetical protein
MNLSCRYQRKRKNRRNWKTNQRKKKNRRNWKTNQKRRKMMKNRMNQRKKRNPSHSLFLFLSSLILAALRVRVVVPSFS